MFFKSKRLSKVTFDNVFKNGRSVHTNYFHVRFIYTRNLPSQNVNKHIIKNASENNRRFAVAISKKVLAGSFQRHRLKRQIVSCLKSEEDKLLSGDYIFFPKKDLLNKDIKLHDAVKEIIQKVGSLRSR